MTTKQVTKKPRKLTKKREGFVKDYVETGNATEAVVRNYPVKDRNSAKVVGSELLTFPNVIEAVEARKETLREAMERQGINSDFISKKVKVLLNSKDHKAVNNGLTHATRIRGDVTDTPPATPTNNTYNFLKITVEDQKEIKNIEARLKEKLIQPHVQKD